MPRSPRVARAIIAATAVVCAGCTTTAGATGVNREAQTLAAASTLTAGPAAAAALAADQADHDEAADHVWNESDVAAVTLTGTSAIETSPAVTVTGSTVTIDAAGTYRLSGSLTDGQIVVNSTGPGIVRLILDGVTIANSTTAPVDVIAAGKVLVFLADGSTNQLSDATTYTYPPDVDEPNAALFSAVNTTIAGTGSLSVTGNADDGITAKDGLVIDAGTITVTAKDDAIRGKDYLVINGGTITATAGGDGLKSDNDVDAACGYISLVAGTVTLTTGGDAVKGKTDVIISGGALTATAGGGSGVAPGDSSPEGLKAGELVVISDGSTTVDVSDDGVNSGAAVTVDGGTTTIAAGDDGVHAETTLTVNAGTVDVTRSYEGVEGFKVYVTGGSLSATATNDAFNASDPAAATGQNSPNALISITGGLVTVNGGSDGIDSNGTLMIAGGTVVTSSASLSGAGNGGLDAASGLTVTGGTLISTGIRATTTTLPGAGQGWIAIKLTADLPAGTVVHLATSHGVVPGDQIAAYRSANALRGLVFSSSQITRGTTYAIYVGGPLSGTAVGGGLYTGGTLAGVLTATVVAGTQRTGGNRP